MKYLYPNGRAPAAGYQGRLKQLAGLLMLTGATLFAAGPSQAAPPSGNTTATSTGIRCTRTLVANVIALDQPLMYNRLGAQNINGMMFALEEDVVDSNGKPLTLGGTKAAGSVKLRADKRPRPLVLRLAAGECLTVNLTNLLHPTANPYAATPAIMTNDDQVADRNAGFFAQGMQAVNSIADMGDNTGKNMSALAAPGQTKTYTLYGEREGTFVVTSYGATFGADGTAGNITNGLFGQLIVLPRGGRAYRNVVSEEDLRLAADKNGDGMLTAAAGELTAGGQPVVNYEATYPNREPWISEGKAGKPVLNMVQDTRIVHTEMDAVVLGPNANGSFPATTYPLENMGKRNPAYPNRLEPFRDFSVVFHDEVTAAQAFPAFYSDPVFGYVLQATRDAFMINYGSGGIGSEIIANRLGVGPMHDCTSCAYEEFFLTAYVVGDPAQLVDIPANVGLEALKPGEAPAPGTTGIKATKVLYPQDPANVHHSYIGDFVKYRNVHVGQEQHVFHLHNHQWLFNPNDDNSNYLDAQGIGPGSGYTYEIVNGGSGNRNRSPGDAIYHCHFYPHFAQGMWYLWRNHDTFEAGTKLAVSNGTKGYHSTPFALQDGTPAAGARAYPDGEVVVGSPIPAVVPLPGKAMAPMPGTVSVVTKYVGANNDIVAGSKAQIDRSAANRNADGTLKNPGYPFWVAGIESTMGQRPPTPPLDMLTQAQATALKASGNTLWQGLVPEQAGGWDGGLARHTIEGTLSGAEAVVTTSPVDFLKKLVSVPAVFFPEEGTDAEQAAMSFHSKPFHGSYAVTPDGSTVTAANFRTNGAKPSVAAPFAEPCIDDTQKQLTASAGAGAWYSGATMSAMWTGAASQFNASTPRVYKGANIQFDAVINKAGYHFPQQRIIALWEDVMPVINKQQPPEPLVMRLNTFDCAMYHHTNLVPEFYELDDYQVRTPTDIIGQHIHLPKWDLSTTDGAANGWNYEDGTISPGAIVERIHAIRHFNLCTTPDARDGTNACPVEQAHPYFGQFGRPDWMGARTTMQRWFSDPLLNQYNIDRGLGNIFTHDHYGPSTHQQIGLYGTVLTEPAGSKWYQAETGTPLYTRADGGPTSWQAVINSGDIDGDKIDDSYREFYLEFTDFQHAYEAGVYVGAGPDGIPNPAAYPTSPESFRYAINPPAKKTTLPIFPDMQRIVAGGEKEGCPVRPCPQAISADDPGMFVVNYRNEPVGLRIYDPSRTGPDGKSGMQADGLAGDLAYALQSRTDRKIDAFNQAPSAITQATGPTGGITIFPPHINSAGDKAGDPFTPMLRTYAGDIVRVRVQAGGQEEAHSVSIHGVKWLQAGSSFGAAGNSGWRNGQMVGISEQFSFGMPVAMYADATRTEADYLYAINSSIEGYWNGSWGVMRNYAEKQADLYATPNNPLPVALSNTADFNGICPKNYVDPKLGVLPVKQRDFNVVVALANDILPNPLGLTIGMAGSDGKHVGGPLKADGGTLVYNSRPTSIPAATIIDEVTGEAITVGGKSGPLHDPTAVMYVRKDDLDPTTGKLNAGVPVEPLVLRAASGECVNLVLENRLPTVMPDLPSPNLMAPVVVRDRYDTTGTTAFNNNLMRPSSHAGFHAQLLMYDVTKSDGTNVGINPVQTVAPGEAPKTYQFYVGDLGRAYSAQTSTIKKATDTVTAVGIEFGGVNIMPADKIKQTQKGLNGAFVAMPPESTWVEDDNMRAAATVTKTTKPELATYRDFALQWAKGLNMRWANGDPVENVAAEGPMVHEDPEDNSAMAVNYKAEPMWYRFQKAPDAPFGHANGAGFADVPNASMAYSNALVGGADPETPVLTVNRGMPFRIHVVQASGGSRMGTFGLHGHVWQRDPYRANNTDSSGYPSRKFGVGSTRILFNPLGMFLGGQESILPAAHFTFNLASAGGANAIPGDYLYRDFESLGNLSGRWGIVRVQ
ncbi:manganese-oxidizing multicopper oxidase MnxG [Aromatoleum toluclasticum]|uniref:manganese-oxidizing multicopper oxidase MnxG n=1 Tax=Aromatoleum toluclasticum TaxID=92003 RepID=UPI00035F9D92|nr:manganese-oxidizing multicopper oxidase MnxG [Aromatoleum toluclasticum]